MAPGACAAERFLKAKPTTKFVPEPFRFRVLFPADADDLAAFIEPHAEQHLVLDPNKVLAAVFERSFEIRPAEEFNRLGLRRVGVQLGNVLRREPWGRRHAPKNGEDSYHRAHQSYADARGPLFHGEFSAVDSSPAVIILPVMEEQEVANVKVGQEVLLKIRALPFDTFHAKVTHIAPCAAKNKRTRRAP